MKSFQKLAVPISGRLGWPVGLALREVGTANFWRLNSKQMHVSLEPGEKQCMFDVFCVLSSSTACKITSPSWYDVSSMRGMLFCLVGSTHKTTPRCIKNLAQ